MKKMKRMFATFLVAMMCVLCAVPAFADDSKPVKVYTPEGEFVASFQSLDEMYAFLEEAPVPYAEAGCGADPTKKHGSATYEKYCGTDYNYEGNYPTVMYAVYCKWCNGLIYIYAVRDD